MADRNKKKKTNWQPTRAFPNIMFERSDVIYKFIVKQLWKLVVLISMEKKRMISRRELERKWGKKEKETKV